MTIRRWQDWVNLALGVWLFVSPWILGYATETVSGSWNAYILGAAIIVFATTAVYLPKVWEEWVNTALGVWMIVSPWILGFANHSIATRNAVVTGILVALFAAWAMARDMDLTKRWHHGSHST